jgi:hypothetical protein
MSHLKGIAQPHRIATALLAVSPIESGVPKDDNPASEIPMVPSFFSVSSS